LDLHCPDFISACLQSLPDVGSTRFVLALPFSIGLSDQFSNQCNPELSALISKTLKLEPSVWLKDLYKLEGLLAHVEDKAFQKAWAAVKQRNKERLAHHVETTLGLTINTHAMFDVQIKVSRA
jgi:glucan phosphorylase